MIDFYRARAATEDEARCVSPLVAFAAMPEMKLFAMSEVPVVVSPSAMPMAEKVVVCVMLPSVFSVTVEFVALSN